ncbi:armadillo-type protein [Aspergillus transmontanensis]|uniref:Armadillo-type protein n=1 Tax=Aspergillus transmontanensis TaxID=1034304 RepID=A0A5N6WAC3_9EURO|nr:armadillo-type protein [Aspergillus transmontanensis]
MSVDVPGQSSDVQVLINEARTLVSQLYDPANTGNPAKIKAIQEHLQILQKGPQAWLIANNLLSDESTDLRFFGALTFTVKINQDWQQLNEDEARELLGRLIDHYVLLVNGGERPLVVRKLASSLATIFLKPNAPWNHALWNLAASLANGKHLLEEQCQSFDLQNAVLPAMSERQVVSLLYFSNILAEEINRWSPESRRNGDSNRASENIKHAFLLVEFVLRHMLQQESSGHSISDGAPGVEAINSYQSWALVRNALQLRDTIRATQLAPATGYVIQSLKVPSLSKTAMQVLVELIDWRDSIFSQDHVYSILEYIISDLGTAHIASIMDADFEDENMTFLELLLAYATLKQRELLVQPLNSEHEKVLALLHTLFQAPGYAAVDDSASPLVLEWWTEVADDLQEIYLDTEEEEGLDPAKRNLARAAMDCFEKLKYPSPEELQEWGDDDRSEFGAFRRDVCDFLLAIYPMLGVELVQVFQERAKSSLVQQDWRTFEAAIFCMAQLSEAVDENQHADECLNAIFFCDEFAQLCTGDVAMIPDKPRQTLVDMLGKYQSYFERTHALLPRVLTFLFASLDVASCASVASKSISHLCKSCRNALTFELPAFMDQFERFRFKPTATASTMEKVLEGIAAIVQTLPTDNEKAQFLERILKFFQEQAELARDEASRGLVEPARCRGQLVLRCVASIGKGLRTDGEIILDTLDGGNGDPYPPTFWNTGNGAVSQNLIMQCMQLLMTDFPLDVTIIEAACDILKAGFTENSGPYVFPPMVTVTFVKSIPLGSAGTDMVMGTASAFLASHSAHPQRIREETVALIVHVYDTFCWMHEKPEFYDPEVANSGIDFLTRLLPKYYPFLFTLTAVPQESNQPGTGHVDGAPQRPPILQAILNFTLLSLQGPEPLPLRSASQFWVGVLNLPYEEEAVQRALRDSIPALCRILASQVAGRCARSDLEHLCEVLRRLIFKQQGLARPHLATTLADLGNDQTNQNQSLAVSPEERQRFLASLLAARGAKAQTSQLTRSFWVKCRGSGFDYIG